MLAMVKCDAGARGPGFRGGAPLGAKGCGCGVRVQKIQRGRLKALRGAASPQVVAALRRQVV